MAVAEVAGARPASALQGSPVIAGQSNTAGSTTELQMASQVQYLSAVRGLAQAPWGTGVAGTAVHGTAPTGVHGLADGEDGWGVWGDTDAGWAVVGTATTGIDLGAVGTGRLYQRPGAAAGPPTDGSYARGEQLRDSRGQLYLCTASGTPGTWVRAAAQQQGYVGGVSHFLSDPIRVYDTRAGFPARSAPGFPLSDGSPRDVQVAGFTYNGVTVPAGVAAVICNLTVVDTDGPGFLTAYPTGRDRPGTSSVNYPAGATVANFAQVRTGGTAAEPSITLAVGGGTAHVLVDLVGFVA